MPQMIKFKVLSSCDGLELYALAIEPDAGPRGIVQIVHGMCSLSAAAGKLLA